MKTIAVIFGGDSGEFEISLESGQVVSSTLREAGYRVFPVCIRNGKWWHECRHGNEYEVDKNDFTLPMVSEKVEFDAAFIAIHGTPGEDGKLQGYFDMIGMPYTTCSASVSALTFNKYYCKQVVAALGGKVARSVLIHAANRSEQEPVAQQLNYPLFVKPNNGGSSVGMSRLAGPDEWDAALEKAFREDDQVLIEEYIPGREITCGVYREGDEVKALPITEIISSNPFFDFEAKYQAGKAEEVVPANIPGEIAEACSRLSVNLYKGLSCRGVVRFDYIFNDQGIFFLEVNTVPGMTHASLIPKMAAAAGIQLADLFTLLVEQATFDGHKAES
ncbi:MAG: D-alanine--D-alanine ligase [Bacteroidales bacterium]